MKKDEVQSTKDEVAVEVLPARADFAEVVAHCQGSSAALIRWHIEAAGALGRMSLAHAIFAGWLLERQKAQVGWGGWGAWCEQNLGFSQKTADRYVELYRKTVGAARTPAGIGSGQIVSAEELEDATEAVDASTATGAMVELGIIRRNGDWGGDRSERAAENGHTVGRRPAAPTPEEASRRDWATVIAPMRKLRDVSYRFLPLADARGALVELDAARARLKARIDELTKAGSRLAEGE